MAFIHQSILAPERGDVSAFRASGENLTVTYDGLAAAVGILASIFQRAGIGHGSRIAVAAPASLELIVSLLAASRCGAAAAPLDLSLRGLSLNDALDRLAPDAIVGFAAPVGRLPRLKLEPRAVIAFDGRTGTAAHELAGTVRQDGSSQRFRLSINPADRDAVEFARGVHKEAKPYDDVLLVSTSGSTGRPKYARLSHRGTLFNVQAHLDSFGLRGSFRAVQALGANYSYGLVASLLGTLVGGGTLVVPPRTDPASIRHTIAAERPTVCLATPALIDYLIDTCPPGERAVLGILEKLGIGGDFCREPLRHKIAEAMPGVDAYVTYGITEAGPRVSTLPPKFFLTRPQSVGLPLAGVAIAIAHADGTECPPGEMGLLHVRTPSRMNGYIGDDSVPFVNEWYGTGDLASIDDAGLLTIHGRADRQFKHRGRRLNPAQIETIIERFPGVLSVRVEPDADGEVLRAIVHHRPKADEDIAHQLREYCRRNLPARLIPNEIIPVADVDGYFFKGRRIHGSEHQLAQTEGPQ